MNRTLYTKFFFPNIDIMVSKLPLIHFLIEILCILYVLQMLLHFYEMDDANSVCV